MNCSLADGKDTRCFIVTDRTDLTIKIENTTDKPLYFQFDSAVSGRTKKGDYFSRFFYAILNQKETGIYNIYDFISLKENALSISFWDFDENRYSKLWSRSLFKNFYRIFACSDSEERGLNILSFMAILRTFWVIIVI